ncbi:MAG: ribonuclease III family protein [Oscillospiraceae bacterium]|nr:ribonuclease III family protein [Oscillospiraceae bacterium]
MEKEILKFIEGQIGYNFNNPNLLQQAFTRRSFSNENGGENNEVLEFIGDKVLDFIIVKLLTEKYSNATGIFEKFDPATQSSLAYAFGAKKPTNETMLISSLNEAELTKLKQLLVQKSTLAERAEALHICNYLLIGNGDNIQSIAQSDSVKEDLFEAILGAVAIDCNWDLKKLQHVVEVMLIPEIILKKKEKDNYISLIQAWSLAKANAYPWYHFEEGRYLYRAPFEGIEQVLYNLDDPLITQTKYRGYLKIRDDLPVFRGFGRSILEARKNVCHLAYEYLRKEGLCLTIRDEIAHPNKEDAINQLEILARRGYFSLPIYDFEETHDENGNPIWHCKCHIPEKKKTCSAKSSSKKEAKKSAAYEVLKSVLKG